MLLSVLTIPTKTGRFILDTDAAEFANGAELLQVQNREEHNAHRIVVFLQHQNIVDIEPPEKNFWQSCVLPDISGIIYCGVILICVLTTVVYSGL